MDKNMMWVDMQDVVGDMAQEHGIPVLQFQDLVTLGKRAVNVYGLHSEAKKISFDEMCEAIKEYISTPFGRNTLKNITNNR